MTTVLAVALAVAVVVFVFFLVSAVAKLPPERKSYEVQYQYHPATYGNTGNGKCRHNRCRRNSRQHPVNGAWRQK